MLVSKKGRGKLQIHKVSKTIIFNMEKAKELHALCASFFIRSNLFVYRCSRERER